MNFDKLISLCQPISVSGTEPDTIGMLRQDSRQVTGGDVFIAIRGLQVDGHLFIEDAIDQGASAIICEEEMAIETDTAILKVTNTRALCGPLAQAFAGHPANKMTTIGITGTNGKTTVATLTYQVLQQLEGKAALLGTVAKRIGSRTVDSKLTTSDPIELAEDMKQMAESGVTHLVMEVSSHALDQQRVNGIPFDVAAFTNLSHDHLDYHETLTAYATAKKMLFDSLDEQATAIINGDDERAAFMIADCSVQTTVFSFNEARDVECQILANTTGGLTVRIGRILIKSPLIGTFNAYNITEAFLICRALGFDNDAIADALQNATGASGRLERVEDNGDGQPVIFVDYAHTPDALRNVSKTLAELKTEQQKLHVIFGCGGNRDKEKRPKMAAAVEAFADIITITSDNPRDEDPEAIIDEAMEGFTEPDKVIQIADRRKAIEHAIRQADRHTIILIAGKGHETYQEIKGQRHDFDDRKVAREALGNRNGNTKPAGA